MEIRLKSRRPQFAGGWKRTCLRPASLRGCLPPPPWWWLCWCWPRWPALSLPPAPPPGATAPDPKILRSSRSGDRNLGSTERSPSASGMFVVPAWAPPLPSPPTTPNSSSNASKSSSSDPLTLSFFFFFFFFFFFLPPSGCGGSAAPSSPSSSYPPSTAAGCRESTVVKSQISISGSKVPMAHMGLRGEVSRGSRSPAATHSANAGNTMSWCTYRFPSSPKSSYTQTSS
mmetsp:Transcript_10867/g.38572  ORF Transcript_10867/g.38572 Transcript_10867/m.38572 type:complete len:229 (-) Transcript_10867:495-1181(-)